MFKSSKIQKSTLIALSVLNLIALGAIGVSAASSSVTFCADKKSGALKYISVGKKCSTKESTIKVNQQGPAGPAGPTGPAGPSGQTGSPGSPAPTIETFEFSPGDVGPAGGVIFFVDKAHQFDWFDYIETAPLSKSDENVLNLGWGAWCVGFSTQSLGGGATALGGIGDGKVATALMLSKCSGGAAHAADTFANSVENNWYLPSKGEAHLAFQILMQYGWQTHTNDGYYTSTEKSATEAWKINGFEMESYFGFKNVENYVLPIRYFS